MGRGNEVEEFELMLRALGKYCEQRQESRMACKKDETLQGRSVQEIGNGVRRLQPDGTTMETLESEGLQGGTGYPQRRHQLTYVLSSEWVGSIFFVADKGECDRMEERVDEMEDRSNLVFAQSEVELEFLKSWERPHVSV